MTDGPAHLTIAICCYNGERYLPATLEALAQQERVEGMQWEIVLVDNASTDRTPVIFQDFAGDHPDLRCRLVREATPGQSAARRCAMEQAAGEWLCFVDDDNILARDYIRLGLAFARTNPKAGAFGGRSVAKPLQAVPSYFGGFASSLAIWDGGKTRCNIGLNRKFTAGMFVRTCAALSLMDEVWMMPGRSPTSPFGGEDAELCIKLVGRGWEIWYLPELCFEHVVPQSRMQLGYLLDLRSRQGGEDLMLRLAYEEAGHLRRSLLQQLARAAFRVCAHLFLGLISLKSKARWTQFSRACFQTGRFRFAPLALARAEKFHECQQASSVAAGAGVGRHASAKDARVLPQIG